MLDRIGDEVARGLDRLQRPAPYSRFSSHWWRRGVPGADDVFQDEHGDYTAGAYVRNRMLKGLSPERAVMARLRDANLSSTALEPGLRPKPVLCHCTGSDHFVTLKRAGAPV